MNSNVNAQHLSCLLFLGRLLFYFKVNGNELNDPKGPDNMTTLKRSKGDICTAATQHLTPTSELCSNSIGPTQQTHDVATTSLQRRCNVVTLQRRCYDVVYLLDMAQQETNSCVCVCVHTGATSGNVPLDMCAQRRF